MVLRLAATLSTKEGFIYLLRIDDIV